MLKRFIVYRLKTQPQSYFLSLRQLLQKQRTSTIWYSIITNGRCFRSLAVYQVFWMGLVKDTEMRQTPLYEESALALDVTGLHMPRSSHWWILALPLSSTVTLHSQEKQPIIKWNTVWCFSQINESKVRESQKWSESLSLGVRNGSRGMRHSLLRS